MPQTGKAAWPRPAPLARRTLQRDAERIRMRCCGLTTRSAVGTPPQRALADARIRLDWLQVPPPTGGARRSSGSVCRPLSRVSTRSPSSDGARASAVAINVPAAVSAPACFHRSLCRCPSVPAVWMVMFSADGMFAGRRRLIVTQPAQCGVELLRRIGGVPGLPDWRCNSWTDRPDRCWSGRHR